MEPQTWLGHVVPTLVTAQSDDQSSKSGKSDVGLAGYLVSADQYERARLVSSQYPSTELSGLTLLRLRQTRPTDPGPVLMRAGSRVSHKSLQKDALERDGMVGSWRPHARAMNSRPSMRLQVQRWLCTASQRKSCRSKIGPNRSTTDLDGKRPPSILFQKSARDAECGIILEISPTSARREPNEAGEAAPTPCAQTSSVHPKPELMDPHVQGRPKPRTSPNPTLPTHIGKEGQEIMVVDPGPWDSGSPPGLGKEYQERMVGDPGPWDRGSPPGLAMARNASRSSKNDNYSHKVKVVTSVPVSFCFCLKLVCPAGKRCTYAA